MDVIAMERINNHKNIINKLKVVNHEKSAQ